MRYLSLLFLILPITALADRLLIAECEIGPDDSYLEYGTRFIIAFHIEESRETIWTLTNGEIELYGSDGPNAPFEVNGGVWSMTLASDIRKSLRQMKFRFLDGNLPLTAEYLSSSPESCDFDYSQIKHYESGEWVQGDDEDTTN